MSPLLTSGLEGLLGDFGVHLIWTALERGTPFADFFTALGESDLHPDFADLRSEWQAAWRQQDLAPMFDALDMYADIPMEWYRYRSVLQEDPYAYQVHVYGRDLDTGRYVSRDTFVNSMVPLNKEEIEWAVRARVGVKRYMMNWDIFEGGVTIRGAFLRTEYEEEW